MREAERGHARVRALGAGWSLSNAAVTDGWLIDTKPLNFHSVGLGHEDVLERAKEDPAQLVFAQCGTAIGELNRSLEARSLALPTSGGADGQTIAGAIATGTHGAAVHVGAMQDFVVGLHVIGEGGTDHWLERASDPIVSEDFCRRLGAELHRDDRLFDAALVSFGSFGLIHAVLLRVEPLYVLERHRIAKDWREVWPAIGSLDVRTLGLPRGEEFPFYFEILLNPYAPADGDRGAFLTAMYKQGPQPTPKDESSGQEPAPDLLGVIGRFADAIPGTASTLGRMQFRQLFPEWHGETQTPGETFGETRIVGRSLSMEIAVALSDAPVATQVLADVAREHPFIGAIAVRYVRKSGALLAHTRFDPITCTIELPAVGSARTIRFYEAAVQSLESHGIDFTMHWGQWNAFTPERVRRMWGTALDDWLAARRSFLSPHGRRTFANDFLERCDLSG